MKVWKCSVCNYIHKGENPPAKCPICGVPASKFIEINEESVPEKQQVKKTAAPKIDEAGIKGPKALPEKDTVFEKVKALLSKYHAHPVSVHTPNGILPIAVILWLMSWFFNAELFAKAAVINMIFVILALPFVISTGVLEWKSKYNGAMTLTFKLKIIAASLTFTSCLISLIWYAFDPKILETPKAWVFIFINVIMIIAVGTAGHIGGKLVYKD
jgi:rubredoxin/uncharacterized membrane protein